MKKQLYILLCCFVVTIFSASAQPPDTESEVKASVNKAFAMFKQQRNIVFEKSLEAELKLEYYSVITKMKPSYFYSRKEAEKAISFYGSAEGTQEVLNNWYLSKETDSTMINSIDRELFKKIYFASKDPNATLNLKANSLNKYATLFIKATPDTLLCDVYINDEFIGTTKELAKMGISVPSEKAHKVEVINSDKKYCVEMVTLRRKERRIKKCIIE